MLFHIANVLDHATLQDVRGGVERLSFQGGKATAGWHARAVKDNMQAVTSPEMARIQSRLSAALTANAVFNAFALPAAIFPALISRTEAGGGYGTHVDDALMGRETRLRSDLSVTIFLSDPESYEGGELTAKTPSGEDSVKLPAGHAVVYPSTTLHCVERVTSGVRLAAVTWVQSLVRDAAVREMLFDLDRARRMMFEKDGKTEAFDLVSKTYSNLLRRHAEV